MLIGSLVYLFLRDAFVTMTALCIGFSAIAVLMAVKLSGGSARSVLVVATLTLSKAFVDYSTSGLENPLSHMLIALFFWVYLGRAALRWRTFFLGLITALTLTNRLDLGLIILPAFLLHVVRHRSKQTCCHALIGLVPFFAWMLFSLVYYGFFFPNTAAAKLNTGLDELALWRQGGAYIHSTIRIDPLTSATLLLGIVLPVWWMRSWKHSMLSVGVLLYLLYVVSFGGDFMTGRFFSVPFFASALLLSRTVPRLPGWGVMLTGLGIALLGVAPARSPVRFQETLERLENHSKIEDERAFYMGCASLRALEEDRDIPDCVLAEKGREARRSGKRYAIKGSVGFYGYFAGPDIHIIDRFALTDPLLARLPMARYENWRIGHFRRDIPEGYVQTVITGENRFKDKNLGVFYQRLETVISGEIWSAERLFEILRFNTGQNDALLAASLNPPSRSNI